MTILTASKARIPTEEFNRVAYKGEIVAVERRGWSTRIHHFCH